MNILTNFAVTLLAITKKHHFYIVVTAIYIFEYLLSKHFGYLSTDIPWEYYQLLDRAALSSNPLRSLTLLHSQPPLLNALLAILLRLESATNLSHEYWTSALFFVLGLVSTLMLTHILLDLVQSRILSILGSCLLLFDPAYIFFQHLFFYPFILQSLLIALVFFTIRLLRDDTLFALTATVIVLASISNIRSLFHPLWALSIYVFLLVINRKMHWISGHFPVTRIALSTTLFIVLLLSWPLKNYLLFSQFTFTTWEGYNIAREWVDMGEISIVLGEGHIPDSVQHEIDEFQRKYDISDTDMLSLTALKKSNGADNWNHFIFTVYNEPLRNKGLIARLHNPRQWLQKTIEYYLFTTRASYVQPYSEQIMGPENEDYRQYVRLHQMVFFYELQSLIGDLSFLRIPVQGQDPLAITLFGIFLLPLLLLSTLILAVHELKTRSFLEFAIVIIMLFTILWVLLLPILTDGYEGNRMRFSVTPYMIVLAVMIAREGLLRIGRLDGKEHP